MPKEGVFPWNRVAIYNEGYYVAKEPELALRYNDGKPQLVFILDFPNAVEGLSNIKSFGAKKYELHNWKRGRGFRDTISSLLRHLMASASEVVDKDSGLPHIDHVVWNALALAEWYRTHPELNDWGPNLNAHNS